MPSMRAPILALLACFAAGDAAGEEAPPGPAPVATEAIELHGSFRGERFWARLLPADERFGGKRVLQLTYTQPGAEVLGGTELIDHPFLLLDGHLGIHAWNEQHSGQGLGAANLRRRGEELVGYRVKMPYLEGEGDDAVMQLETKDLACTEPLWDSRLAPILLALAYREVDGVRPAAEICCADFFAAEVTDIGRVSWADRLFDTPFGRHRIAVDDHGYLAGLTPVAVAGDAEPDGDGRDGEAGPLLTVAGWLAGHPTAGPPEDIPLEDDD